ncbi:MAG TPA: ABC transporter ATP-binding protein [Xanthobacteraceae bacterium]
MLRIENVKSGYGRIEALHGISLEVAAGEVVALLGANGAGKTTLVRAISGVQPISAGQIRFQGQPIERLPAHARVALGIAQVPEGRQLFAPLAVEDNLRLGAWTRADLDLQAGLAAVYDMFPILAERRAAPAGTLSGGQQQMLAIGRALMAKPRLLLLDEPSMGLAPMLVERILGVVRELKRAGLTVLLIEQNARAALAIADRAYVLETGKITASGTAAQIRFDPRVRQAYLGV